MFSDEKYLQQVQLVANIVDEMSVEPTIRAQPPGFKNTLRTQYTIIDFFRRQISQQDRIQEERDREARSYA